MSVCLPVGGASVLRKLRQVSVDWRRTQERIQRSVKLELSTEGLKNMNYTSNNTGNMEPKLIYQDTITTNNSEDRLISIQLPPKSLNEIVI